MDMAQAKRKRAIAEALLKSSMTPGQSEMVGRYRVGEGLGGITRLGEALLGRKLAGQAGMAEQSAAESMNAAKSMALQDVMTAAQSGDNRALAAALMGYQSKTGEALDKNYLDLLAPDQEAFGADVKEVLDANGNPVLVQASKRGGVRPVEGYKPIPRVEKPAPIAKPEPTIQDKAAEAAAIEEAKVAAREKARRESEAMAKGETASDALDVIDRFIGSIERQPKTPFGRAWESGLAAFDAGNKGEQAAMAEYETLGAALVPFATKQPGPSSDKDVQIYKASVGVASNPSLSQSQRLAAAKVAKELLTRIRNKYGDNWQPVSTGQDSGGFGYQGEQ